MRNLGKVRISGWNRQNVGNSNLMSISDEDTSIRIKGIARGSGLAYGDAALNFSHNVFKFDEKVFDGKFIEDKFDTIVVDAQMKVGDVCQYLIESNRFLPTVPGSIDATIGGCLSADVHGKNDHRSGSFGRSVVALQILDQNGITTINDNHPEFKFHVSSFGLTGIFKRVEIKTKPLQGNRLLASTYIVSSLSELLESMTQLQDSHEYVVGWMDYVNKNRRGFIEVADWGVGKSTYNKKNLKFRIPAKFPNVINRFTVGIYNCLVFRLAKRKSSRGTYELAYDNYLFPTLAIQNWNFLFGKNGFHEIQILVKDQHVKELENELNLLSKQFPIFLAGFKRIEKEGIGLMSFPSQGWSVAINIPGKYISKETVSAILVNLYNKFECRQYLAKDSALTVKLAEKMYPNIDEFRAYREHKKLNNFFISEMSLRLNL